MSTRETLAGLPPWYVSDPPGKDLRPDPDAITTVPQLLAAMRLYHMWSGNPRLVVLAHRCRHRVSASTFRRALEGDALPSLPVLHDLIGACGSTPEYRERFEQAWHKVAAGAPRVV